VHMPLAYISAQSRSLGRQLRFVRVVIDIKAEGVPAGLYLGIKCGGESSQLNFFFLRRPPCLGTSHNVTSALRSNGIFQPTHAAPKYPPTLDAAKSRIRAMTRREKGENAYNG
jgi:hypothetical protein